MAGHNFGKGGSSNDGPTSSPGPTLASPPPAATPEPAPAGGLSQTIKKVVVIVVIAVVALGGTIKKFLGGGLKAEVVCVAEGAGVRCDVSHKKGSDRANVCWSLAVTCANAKTATGKACQEVDAGQKAAFTFEPAQLSGFDACDKPSKLDVSDLKVAKAP